jgi:putative YhbY family RNA-binding protein
MNTQIESMLPPLSSLDRRKLRAKAHALVPVVMISAAGPTPSVIAEIGRALAAHELIKIRAFSDVRSEREAWLVTICESLAAAPVQHIGKILVIYRPQSESEGKKAGASAKRRRSPRKTKKQMLA